MTEQHFSQRLREAGLKVTPVRMAILQTLGQGCRPLSVEQIRQQLRNQRCDLVTLYRALGSFEKAKLIRKCEFGDGSARFELQEQGHHHHHIVCRSCHNISPIDRCLVETLEKSLREEGYAHLSHSLEFFGICPSCQS